MEMPAPLLTGSPPAAVLRPRTQVLGAECGSPRPQRAGWVVYFCFPAVRLQLDYSVLTSQPDPPIKCGFGALLFFSHPSCF